MTTQVMKGLFGVGGKKKLEKPKVSPPWRKKKGTAPKLNSEFTPEKWWLEDDPFLLGFGNFSGANC